MRARRPNIIRAHARPGPPRGARLGLMLTSCVLALVCLETLARLSDPTPAPVLFRDGIYINTLPLVNGDTSGIGVLPTKVEPLPQEKSADELRIVVLGESSTQGFPGGAEQSPVTLLQEQLRLSHPNRRITLINLGRCGAVTRDGYYYLLYARRFQPDAILFYMGTNDCCSMDGELCMPLEHPSTHAAWRWAVEHIRVLWLARAYGPQLLRSRLMGGTQSGGSRPPCDVTSAVERWTALLLDTAQASGANVLVSLPVFSQHARIEYWERAVRSSRAHDTWDGGAGALDPEYAQLLACRLDPNCPFSSTLETFLAKKDQEHSGQTGNDFPHQLERAWRLAAEARNIPVIAPDSAFIERAEKAEIGPPAVLDNVHLSADGAWTLAETWHQALLPLLGLNDAQTRALEQAPELARTPFLSRMAGQGKQQAIEEGFRLLGRRHPFFALSYFEHAQNLTALEQQLNAQDEGRPCATLSQTAAWSRLQHALPHWTQRLEKTLQTPALRGHLPLDALETNAQNSLKRLEHALPGLTRTLVQTDPGLSSLHDQGAEASDAQTMAPKQPPTPEVSADGVLAVPVDALPALGQAWIRQRIGQPPGLPQDLEPALERLSPTQPIAMTEDGWACLTARDPESSPGGPRNP